LPDISLVVTKGESLERFRFAMKVRCLPPVTGKMNLDAPLFQFGLDRREIAIAVARVASH
jgi:hypothetical protein